MIWNFFPFDLLVGWLFKTILNFIFWPLYPITLFTSLLWNFIPETPFAILFGVLTFVIPFLFLFNCWLLAIWLGFGVTFTLSLSTIWVELPPFILCVIGGIVALLLGATSGWRY